MKTKLKKVAALLGLIALVAMSAFAIDHNNHRIEDEMQYHINGKGFPQ